MRRREILKKLMPKEGSIRFSDAIEGRGIEFFRAARERGLEGIMAKRKGSRYLPGRWSENWLKIKARMQQEAVIGGIIEPSGARHYFGALMLGVYPKAKQRSLDALRWGLIPYWGCPRTAPTSPPHSIISKSS